MNTSIAAVLLIAAELYRSALPGYRYDFPRDHFNHPEFQTEWWYYTGNLHDAQGRKFGFELTFFRQGVVRSKQPPDVWDVRDVWLAHLALSDLDGGKFLHAQRLNRSGAGLAGASFDQVRVWNGNWSVLWDLHAGTQRLQAVDRRFSLDFSMRSLKPPVIHGSNGVSQKAAGPGQASHYVSLTRIETKGSIMLGGRTFFVEGLAWMDHEIFTHQLAAGQTGWDWFSLQFDDGTELMLYRFRRENGTLDPFSAGTYIDKAGKTTNLTASQFAVVPGKMWQKYPIEWTVRVPSLGIDAQLTTRLPNQELDDSQQNRYWEGAIEVSGTRRGVGYLEMTGYAAPVPSVIKGDR